MTDQVDVVVIGTGFGGAITAFHLAESGASVIMRTASSSVKSWRSRTQCASRCVWIEQSDIWLTCAPASENAMTVRGCFSSVFTAS